MSRKWWLLFTVSLLISFASVAAGFLLPNLLSFTENIIAEIFGIGIAIALVIGIALLYSGASDTTEAKKKNKVPEVTFEFSATFDDTKITATEIVALTLCVANIGSSGQDGVTTTTCPDGTGQGGASDFQVDSFFDVSYRLFGDPDFDIFGDPDFDFLKQGRVTIDIELVALQLTSVDPVAVIDRVRTEMLKLSLVTEYRGHVTVLK